MSDFYDLTSPLNNTIIEDKSDIDLEQDIPLCDICQNVILKPYQNNKLVCPQCGNIEDPHYEIIKTQDQETTLDELSSQGTLTYQDDFKDKKIRKTLNHADAKLEDLEYVAREFERYRQIEIIDKDTITGLNKTKRRSKQNNE